MTTLVKAMANLFSRVVFEARACGAVAQLLAVLLIVAAMTATVSIADAVAAGPAGDAGATAAEGSDSPGSPGSRFILNAHDGRTVSDEDFRGRHMLVFFGYTHCPDVCPTSLLTVARVLELLGRDAAKVQPIFVTVDPVRDTREVLAKFVQHFDSRIIGLTGSEPMIERVAKGYRVKYAKVPASGDGFYTIDHTASMFHMGPDGGYVERFPYETTPEDIVGRLRASFKR